MIVPTAWLPSGHSAYLEGNEDKFKVAGPTAIICLDFYFQSGSVKYNIIIDNGFTLLVIAVHRTMFEYKLTLHGAFFFVGSSAYPLATTSESVF